MKLVTHLQQGKLIYLDKDSDDISILENNHYLWLMFGNTVQSVMLKRAPYQFTIAHHYFLALPLLFCTPIHIVELGLGGGNLVRFFDKRLPNVKITSVEYSQSVINCFHQFFNPQKIKHNIVNNLFERWLIKQKTHHHDWIIFDIFRKNSQADYFIKQISTLLDKANDTSWLSINLPDLSEHELNNALLHLSIIKGKRAMRYFQIPHYKNIIIHISPNDFNFSTQNSSLPDFLVSRWKKLWRHGMTN